MTGPVVDARGLRCPLPVLRLATALRHVPVGTTATLVATDPAVAYDVPAWAAMKAHHVLSTLEQDGVWTIRVRTG